MGSASYAGRSYGVAAGPDPHVVSLVTLGTPHGTTEQYPFGRVPERRPMEPLTLPADVQGSRRALAPESALCCAVPCAAPDSGAASTLAACDLPVTSTPAPRASHASA